jgi:D-alanine-D-alanine ligase-like ATP-grasp enzyme
LKGKPADPRFLAHLFATKGLRLESILDDGACLPIHFIANLSASGTFRGLIEPVPSLQHWAQRLFAALPLHVMGVDVFSASALGNTDDFVVTDINASPALTTLSDLGETEAVDKAWDAILAAFSPG